MEPAQVPTCDWQELSSLNALWETVGNHNKDVFCFHLPVIHSLNGLLGHLHLHTQDLLFFMLLLRYSWCTLSYKCQVYNIVIHDFFKKYWILKKFIAEHWSGPGKRTMSGCYTLKWEKNISKVHTNFGLVLTGIHGQQNFWNSINLSGFCFSSNDSRCLGRS